MSSEDIEAIRLRIASLLNDCTAIKRMADRIDQETREIFHLLPEHLRPTGIPRPQKPREPRSEGPDGREHPGPKPGGPIPREVRWPDWTIEHILELADAYKEQHGKWPTSNSGRINDVSPDTWTGIDLALKKGHRGLPGGTTLARLLAQHRRARTRSSIPPLDLETILAWADEHHANTGKWPTVQSGPVATAPGETWVAIDHALKRGRRGMTVKTSLARLLAEKRGAPYSLGLEPLTEEQILAWADAHYERTGKWPTRASGDILEAPHENWGRINTALIQGNRALPGGSSLARLLAARRDLRNRKALPHFDVEEILRWADLHHEHNQRWPTCWDKEIEDAPGETWRAVDSALKQGCRGLAESGYRSLAQLLDARRGKLQRHGNRPAERIPPAAP